MFKNCFFIPNKALYSAPSISIFIRLGMYEEKALSYLIKEIIFLPFIDILLTYLNYFQNLEYRFDQSPKKSV